MIDSDYPELTRTLVRARADGVPQRWVARRYRNLLLDNGFTDVTVEVHTLVWTDAACLPMLASIGGEGAWLDDQAARARNDRLFFRHTIHSLLRDSRRLSTAGDSQLTGIVK